MTGIPTSDYPLPAARPAWSVLDNGAINAAFGITLPDWDSRLAQCLGAGRGNAVTADSTA